MSKNCLIKNYNNFIKKYKIKNKLIIKPTKVNEFLKNAK